jgi:hypothetical protein
MARQHNGSNNGLLQFTANAGAALGLTSVETEGALEELESVGLIDRRGERS